MSFSHAHTKEIPVSAIVVPKATCNLPLHPDSFDSHWTHLSGLQLADTESDKPGQVDLLLCTDVFVEGMIHGRRTCLPGSRVAFKTSLGWVLTEEPGHQIVSNHAMPYIPQSCQLIMSYRSSGKLRSVSRVPQSCLLKNNVSSSTSMRTNHLPLMEDSFSSCPGNLNLKFFVRVGHQQLDAFSRSSVLYMQEVNLELSKIMSEYFEMEHAEEVPELFVNHHPLRHTLYLPMHTVHKDSSTTIKL